MPQLTRKAANAQLMQLRAQLEAQGGETRKNLRQRIARLTEEAAKAKTALSISEATAKRQEEALKEIADALRPHKGKGTTEEAVFLKLLQPYASVLVPSTEAAKPS